MMSSNLTIMANNTNWLNPTPTFQGPSMWKTPKKTKTPGSLGTDLTEMQHIIEDLQSSHDAIKRQLKLIEACLMSLEAVMQSSSVAGFASAGSAEVAEARDEMTANLMNLALLGEVVARIRARVDEEQITEKKEDTDDMDFW